MRTRKIRALSIVVALAAALLCTGATTAARTYGICTVTSDIPGAGTNSRVEIRVNGSLGSSPFLDLNDPDRNDFEAGHADCFNRVLSDVGTMQSVDVRFTRKSHDQTYTWHLAYVVVAESQLSRFFPHNRWFTASATRNLPIA
jgi:hypothetical protein